ncbi:winged helix-turn-helix transcriptional regulator [Bacillus cereus group sp. BfR-BA-01316]|uniref:Lrp/AsnC family transcriptional regulator n=1 Tax=Bacillus cereus group sp. BfR-BA-01316 TaxID=2920293 RepID=UPI002814A522|nr:winged helix-turn-helix transcriptional regulator [Bacillus cereus group sp. BfR-BA-01316]
MQNAVKLDEIDHKIMNLLYKNARISVSEIGRIISMTQPAAKELINKLEDQGVIAAYRTKFEPSKINKNIQAFIMFKTSQCSDFIQLCNAAPEVTDHPLSIEQRDGIKLNRIQEIAEEICYQNNEEIND